MTGSNDIPDKRTGSVDQQHQTGAGQPHEAGAGDKQGVGHHHRLWIQLGSRQTECFNGLLSWGGDEELVEKFQTRDE